MITEKRQKSIRQPCQKLETPYGVSAPEIDQQPLRIPPPAIKHPPSNRDSVQARSPLDSHRGRDGSQRSSGDVEKGSLDYQPMQTLRCPSHNTSAAYTDVTDDEFEVSNDDPKRHTVWILVSKLPWTTHNAGILI